MKITSRGDTVYLADEETGKSAVLRLRDGVWKLSLPSETLTYPDLETAISFADRILADCREGEDSNEKTS